MTAPTCAVRTCTTFPSWVLHAIHHTHGNRTLLACGRHRDSLCGRLANDIGTPTIRPYQTARPDTPLDTDQITGQGDLLTLLETGGDA
jgi:hypothetical protein